MPRSKPLKQQCTVDLVAMETFGSVLKLFILSSEVEQVAYSIMGSPWAEAVFMDRHCP